MKPNAKPGTDDAVIHRILVAEEELIPSSGFLAATMERVREEAACPKPIPFPWLRALPGIVLGLSLFGWCGFEIVRAGLRSAGETSFVPPHLTTVNAHALEPVGWIAVALVVPMVSWILSRRIAGRSGLL
jgi:hypothetical protein